MTSDINGTVTGIQGVEVSTTTPTSGQVLTYVSADNKWEPQGPAGSHSQAFTSSGTWTAPAGINTVWLTGWGGGGGGAAGDTTTSLSSGGGGGSALSTLVIPVTPGNNYTVTIGAGGTAGNDGANTTFGSLATFVGGGKAGSPNRNFSGGNSPGIVSSTLVFTTGFGGNQAYASVQSSTGYAGGAGGSDSVAYFGAGGGGGGPGGVGGTGGNGNNAGAGTAGGSAAANSGAGGGGGGSGSSSGGAGGSGGSGQLTIVY